MKKSAIFFALLLFVIIVSTKAQEVVPAAGGEAAGGGGTASYTIGQMVYATHTGSNGYTLAQGVQQPFEISVVSGINPPGKSGLTLSVYPNPVKGHVTVKVKNAETDHLLYQLFDANGKLLESKKATGRQTQWDLSEYRAAVYFLKVTDHDKEIKTFKIIKH